MSELRRLALRAPRRGELPPDGAVTVGGRSMRGRRFSADPAFGTEPGVEPVGPDDRGWLTDDVIVDVAEHWWRHALHFPDTGLWPLVTDGLDGDLNRPWRDGELGPVEDPESVDVGTFLLQTWEENVSEDDDTPASQWTGLAAAVPGEPDVAVLPAGLECPPRSALLLVPVTRPADVLAALGWLGAENHDLGGGQLSAVLRSWEERFGAVPVCLGFDSMVLAVSRPPVDRAEVDRLAQEQYAVCPDNVDQGAGSIERYAEEIAGQRLWSFWWD